MKVIWLILVALLLTGLNKQPKNDIHLQWKIAKKHMEEMFKTYGLRVDGTGGSGPVEIEGLFISYVSTMKVDVKTARKIYVDAVEKLVHMLNSEKKIRPYMHEFPCNFRTAQINLAFIANDGNFISEEGKLAFVYVKNGKIYYKIDNPQTEEFIGVHSEPYEEALRIVNGESKTSNDKKGL